MSNTNNMTLDKDVFEGKKIFIAIPTHDGKIFADTSIGLLNLTYTAATIGMDVEIYFLKNESHIDRARNVCVSKFLDDSRADLMLFLDSDITFNYMQLLMMIQYALKESDTYQVLGGFYPKKTIEWGRVAEAVKGGIETEKLPYVAGKGVYNLSERKEFNLYEPVEVDYVGTGCMLISRQVLENFVDRRPEIVYSSDHPEYDGMMRAVFSSGLVDGRWLSEDYYFCHEIKNDGVKIWLCPFVNNGHIGNYEFRGMA